MGDYSSYDSDGSDEDRTETGSQEERWEMRFQTDGQGGFDRGDDMQPLT